MKKSILNGKLILAVDDEPDILELLKAEILGACPNSKLDKATSYQEAADMLRSRNYDLVILDIMGVRGFDLLDLSVNRGLPVVILTAHALNPETLKHSIDMGARAYLPKEKLGEIVPFLEDILEESYPLSGWAHQMKKLEGFYNNRWGETWQKKEEKYWKEFYKKALHIRL
jgi:DNA-binding response OmpR family regulator